MIEAFSTIIGVAIYALAIIVVFGLIFHQD